MTEQALRFVISANSEAAVRALRDVEGRLTQAGAKVQQVGRTSAQAGRELNRSAQGVAALSAEMGRLGTSVASAFDAFLPGGPLTAAIGQAERMRMTAAALPPVLGAVTIAAAAAAAGLAALAGAGLAAFAGREREMLTLEQVVRATGGAAGRSAQDIAALAGAISQATLAGESQVRQAAAQLLTFRSVAGETFDRTLLLAQDLAAVGFGSMSSAAVQLGKALENPIQGMASLREVGVSFTAAQQQMIRGFVETGQAAEAQRAILDAVAIQVGGAGAAQGAGLAGGFHQLREATGNFLETVGERVANLIGLNEALRATAEAVRGLQSVIEPAGPRDLADVDADLAARRAQILDDRAEAEARLAEIEARIAATLSRGGSGARRPEVQADRQEAARLRALLDRPAPDAAAIEAAVADLERIEAAIERRLAEGSSRRRNRARDASVAELRRQADAVRDAMPEAAIAELERERQRMLAEIARRNQEAADARVNEARERFEGARDALIEEGAAARQTAADRAALNAIRAAGVDVASAEADQLRAIARANAEGAAQARGEAELARLQQQVQMAELIARYGADSVQVAQARAAAERAAAEETYRAWGLSEDLVRALMSAYDAQQRIAGVDMTPGIRAAIAETQRLRGELEAAAAAAARIGQQAADELAESEIELRFATDPVGRAGARARLRAARDIPIVAAEDEVIRIAEAQRREEAIARRVEAAEQAERNRMRAAAIRSASVGRPGGSGGGAAAIGELDQLRDRARSTMEEVGLTIAGVQERVRAGLMTTAEATTAIEDANRRAAEAIADLIPRIEAMGPAGAASAEQMRQALQQMVQGLEPIEEELARIKEGFESSAANIVAQWLKGTMTMGEAFEAFGDLVISTIAEIAAKRITEQLIMPLINPLIDGFIGLFNFGAAQGAVVSAGAVQPFAKGGIPALSAHSNTVVTRPTLFAMQGGTGLMGEAGAEAIMPLVGGGVRAVTAAGEGALPLTRTASGYLAVEAFARGGIPGLPDSVARAVAASASDMLPAWLRSVMPAAPAAQTGPAANAAAAPVPVGGRGTRVEVHNHSGRGDERVTEERFIQGDDDVIRIIIEAVDAGLAENAMRGRGQLTGVLGQAFGARRRGA